MTRFDLRFLAGATHRGLVVVGPESEVEIELEERGSRFRLLDVLRDEVSPATLVSAGLSAADAEQLFEALRELGALAEDGGEEGRLASASLGELVAERLIRGREIIASTREELLFVPALAAVEVRRRSLRAFVAGLHPQGRLAAYGFAASSRSNTVLGDCPDRASLEAALAQAREISEGATSGEARPVTVDLRNGSAVAHEVGDVLSGWERSGRLGVVQVTACRRVGEQALLRHALARHACPNLHFASDHDGSCQGVGETESAATRIAWAEAVERFAAGDSQAKGMVRATRIELGEAAIAGDSIVTYGERAYSRNRYSRFDEGEEYLWVRARTLAGEGRFIPADYVYYPWLDPAAPGRRLASASSSGVAAHADRTTAIESAVAELLEREAILWTWVQRISRPRIPHRYLDPAERAVVEDLEGAGWRVHLLDISLELGSVVLAVAALPRSIVLGAGCSADPNGAVMRAVRELAPLCGGQPRGREGLAAEDVNTPADHGRLYVDSDLAAGASFLYASEEMVEPHPPTPALSLTEALAKRNQLLVVDFESPAADLLHVVRVIAPGVVPLTFGYDCEPWGMQRLCMPIIGSDSIEAGSFLTEPELPLQPHPFA